MSEILKFVSDNPVMSAFLAFLAFMLLVCLWVHIPKLIIRHLNVRKAGWPPPHLDAAGEYCACRPDESEEWSTSRNNGMGTGIELIAAERERQLSAEGWTPEHDDQHVNGELATAGVCYALQESTAQRMAIRSMLWPWADRWWKPSDDPVKNLVKAGALIAAEIDRLQRAQEKPKSKTQ